MNRKLLGRAVAVFALGAGLVVLAAQASNADHTTPVPTEPVTTATGTAAGQDANTVDMSTWQTTRETKGPGSKFKPKPKP